jgi:hypothetical protein
VDNLATFMAFPSMGLAKNEGRPQHIKTRLGVSCRSGQNDRTVHADGTEAQPDSRTEAPAGASWCRAHPGEMRHSHEACSAPAGLVDARALGQLGTEVQCAAVLEQLRWLRGVHRPHCGEVRHGVLRVWARRICPCGGCRPQLSLIGGTVFQGTNLALTVWYLAIYFISQAKTSLSAPVPGFTRKSVATWASALVCDWRSCFGGITDAGRQHRPVVAGRDHQAASRGVVAPRWDSLLIKTGH